MNDEVWFCNNERQRFVLPASAVFVTLVILRAFYIRNLPDKFRKEEFKWASGNDSSNIVFDERKKPEQRFAHKASQCLFFFAA